MDVDVNIHVCAGRSLKLLDQTLATQRLFERKKDNAHRRLAVRPFERRCRASTDLRVIAITHRYKWKRNGFPGLAVDPIASIEPETDGHLEFGFEAESRTYEARRELTNTKLDN